MRKDGVGGPCLLSLSLSFKRQRWDFYDPQYYCVWALLSLLQAAKNYRLPMLYSQVCRFSIQTTHAMSQPRLKGGPRKPPISSSAAALCLAFSTHQAQLPLHCCLGALWDGLGLSPPLMWDMSTCDVEFCRCGGAVTMRLHATSPILSREPAFWPSFFSFILVFDIIFLQCILFSISGITFTLTVQLSLERDCLHLRL